MKKVLILAYDFPPYVSVSGLRPYSWYKYFSEYGIFPIVITRQWSNKHGNYLDYISPSETHETIVEKSDKGIIYKTEFKPNLANKLLLKYGENKFKFLRKIITAYYEFSQYLITSGPKSGIYNEANKFLEHYKVDYIIATGEPFVLFYYASKLSKKYNVPWIADYRDPWSQDIYLQYSKMLKLWSVFQERKIIKNVFAVTTVSNFVKGKIEKFYTGNNIKIITNGYDFDAIQQAKNVKQNAEILSIGFAGSIYYYHPIKEVLKVLSSIVLENPNMKIRLNLYGVNISNNLSEIIQNEFKELHSIVRIVPKMQYDLLLQELAKNNLLLLFNYYSYMGTKIYDYLGLKRKILLCFTNDREALALKKKYYKINEEGNINNQMQADLISKTNSGIVIEDKDMLKNTLIKLYEEFLEKREIKCNSVEIEDYSRKTQAKNMSEFILNELNRKT